MGETLADNFDDVQQILKPTAHLPPPIEPPNFSMADDYGDIEELFEPIIKKNRARPDFKTPKNSRYDVYNPLNRRPKKDHKIRIQAGNSAHQEYLRKHWKDITKDLFGRKIEKQMEPIVNGATIQKAIPIEQTDEYKEMKRKGEELMQEWRKRRSKQLTREERLRMSEEVLNFPPIDIIGKPRKLKQYADIESENFKRVSIKPFQKEYYEKLMGQAMAKQMGQDIRDFNRKTVQGKIEDWKREWILDSNMFSNYCGLGGNGPVRHEMDAICNTHDENYEIIRERGRNPYIEYNWADAIMLDQIKRLPNKPRRLEELLVQWGGTNFIDFKQLFLDFRQRIR